MIRRFIVVVALMMGVVFSGCGKSTSPVSPTPLSTPSLESTPVVSVVSNDPVSGTGVVSYNLNIKGFPPYSVVGVYPCWGNSPTSIEGPCPLASTSLADGNGRTQFAVGNFPIPLPPGTHNYFVIVVAGDIVTPPPMPPPIVAVPSGAVVYAVPSNN